MSEGQNLCVTFFQTDGLCKNEGECRPSCDEPPFYECACTSEWEGHNCTIKVLNYFQLLWADLVLTQGTLRKVLHLSISLLRYLLCLLLTSWDVIGLSKFWRHISSALRTFTYCTLCTADHLFYWFSINQTSKSDDRFNVTKLLHTNQPNRRSELMS